MKHNKFVLGFLLGLTFLLFMGAFTRDWTESTPTDNTVANQIDDYNRYLRVDMSDRLKNMVYGLIAGENTLSQHFQYVQFYEQASVSQPSAGYGRLYTKAVGGKCEMFWQDEDADEIELTYGGKFMIGYGTASQAFMWNTTEENGENGRESQIRAKGEQDGTEISTLGYLEFSHDGTADDQKGRVRIVVNDGDDDDTPSKIAIVYQSDGAIDVGDSVSVVDEDDMTSDSATKVSTEQSIKAFVESKQLTYDGTQLFTGTAPTSYTDINIATVASLTAQRMKVFMSVTTTTSGDKWFNFRPNGETAVTSTSQPAGTGNCNIGANEMAYIAMMTDTSGIIEWLSISASTNCTIKLLTWEKVN